MRNLQSILLVPVILVFAVCCGEEKQTPAAGPATAEMQPERTYGLNPLLLEDDRYIEEMIRYDEREAYLQQPGDYIDPQRIIELLEETRGESLEEEEEEGPIAAQPRISSGWRIIESAHQEAMSLFEAGDLDGAIAQWQGFQADQRAFTLSVEVDCDASILRRTYSLLQALEAPVFVLPVTVGDKNCYRICLGIFSAHSQVGEWIERVRSRVPESYPFVHEVRKTSP